MKSILKACFGRNTDSYKEILETILKDNEYYKNLGVELLSSREIKVVEYMLKTYTDTKVFPTIRMLYSEFGEYLDKLDFVVTLEYEDLKVYIAKFVHDRVNKGVSDVVLKYTEQIKIDGVSDEILEKMAQLSLLGNTLTKEIALNMNFTEIYEEKIKKSVGLTTGISEIDAKIGGMSEGTVTTIAGYTSHFKTTLAMNIAYLNAYHHGYNLVYLSLETPKEDMYFNLLCRHSYDIKFAKYSFIPHEKIRRCELLDGERDYLYNVVEPDLFADYQGDDGSVYKRGRVIILDESDFNSMSFTDINNVFEQIDDKLDGNLDGFIVDYAQLCKFSDYGKASDDNRIINAYVTFFRRLTQKFRHGKKQKKLIGILLSQINRESWKRAARKNGAYDLTCLADANELERGSYRVITTYTTEEMKAIKEASLQILKNRGGPTMWEPLPVYADGESYVFGEELQSFGNTPAGSSGSMEEMFSQAGLDTIL